MQGELQEDRMPARPAPAAQDTTPDEISAFITENDIGDRFNVTIKEKRKEGGRPEILSNFSNIKPSLTQMGKEWGPGSYEVHITWDEALPNGAVKPHKKMLDITLSERAWREIHEDYLAEKQTQRLTVKQKKWAMEAEEAKAKGLDPRSMGNGGGQGFGGIQEAIALLKSLGIDVGGPAKPKTLLETINEMAPLIIAVTPMVQAFFGAKKESYLAMGDSQNDIMKLLLDKTLNRPESNPFNERIQEGMFGMFTKILEMKEAMQPQEKESLIERVTGKIFENLPLIAQMAQMSAKEKANNLMYQATKAHPDFKAVEQNLDVQIGITQRLDRKFGFQQANMIIGGLGFTRPPVLAGAFRDFPSPGYDKEGGRIGAAPAQAAQASQAAAEAPPEPQTEAQRQEAARAAMRGGVAAPDETGNNVQ
jgi:hypothetical protein